MIITIISMFIFALVGGISPGPVNIIATGSGASFGFRRTLPHVMGATVSYTLIVLLAGLGLNHWLIIFPDINNALQYLGSAFLLYMSYKIATAIPLNSNVINTEERVIIDENKKQDKRPPSFIEGALAQILNPKAWLVSMSGIGLFVTIHSQTMLYLFIFCAVSFIACFMGISTWAAIGHSIRRLLSTIKRQIAFNMLMGLMLSGTVFSILIFH